MHKALYNIYKTLVRSRLSFFACLSVFIIIIIIYLPTRIQFEEDISKFIPKNSQNEELQHIISSVNFDDKVILNLKSINDSNQDHLTDFAYEFIERIQKDSMLFNVRLQGYIENEDALKMVDFAYEFAPFLLAQKDYKALEEKLTYSNIESQVESNYNELVAPSSFMSKSFILKDPLQISLLGIKNLNPSNSPEDFEIKDGFLVTKDHQNLLLFINPNDSADKQDLVENLYQIIEEIGFNYNQTVQASFFGGPIIAYANAKQIKKDIMVTLSIASIILIILFVSFYRKIFIPFILILPTLIGGLFGLGLLWLIRDNISAISLGIGSILMGVTFDYSLHILTHLRSGKSVKDLYKNLTRPILMSSCTTALAFLSIIIIESQALQDLGIFAACSVLFASLSALVLIPLLYKPNSKEKSHFKTDETENDSQFLDSIGAISLHQNRPLIIIILLIMIISAFTYNKVDFNENLSDLNYFPSSLKTIEKELDALVNTESKSIYIATYDNTLEQALLKNDSLYTALSELKRNNEILSINSLRNYVPSNKTQNEAKNTWNRFWTNEKKAKVKNDLIASGNTYGFKDDAFMDFYEYLDQSFEPITLASYDSIDPISLEDYIVLNDSLVVISTMVKLDKENTSSISSAVNEFDNSVVIDRQSLNETMLGNLKSEFNLLLRYCVIAVLGFLILIYRSFKLSLITFLPIILTWVITIGIMGLIGIQFNIFNIIISSFIFGLGIDYSIFITNGLQLKDKIGLIGFNTTKTSIILSVITTVVGIGALLFAKHPALKSIALISIIGILTAMFISFTIQPLLYNVIMKKKLWVR